MPTSLPYGFLGLLLLVVDLLLAVVVVVVVEEVADEPNSVMDKPDGRMTKILPDFPIMKNDLILRAARGETVERAPVWIMRQAGRYLPEFQELRKKHEFFEICRTPELACEITLQPIRRYSGLLDASIIFSDILVVPQALGMVVEMRPGVGPVFPSPLETTEQLSSLKEPAAALKDLQYVYDAITLTRQKLDGCVPLIGFTGAPWTLMSYMIEGGGSKTLAKGKRWLYRHPDASHKLLQLLTDVNIDYLVGQVLAGAQMLQVFESHAEYLSPGLFATFSLPYLQQTAEKVKEKLLDLGMDPVPMVVFAKGGGLHALESLKSSSYDVLGLDWTVRPADARQIVKGSGKVLQGNMDPCGLYADQVDIEKMAGDMVEAFGFGRKAEGNVGWIANLGHGIYPDVDPENLKHFLSAIHKCSSQG